MTIDEMKEKARARVEKDNPESKEFEASPRIFENIMNGTVVRVDFTTPTGNKDHNLVHFGPNEMRPYRGGIATFFGPCPCHESGFGSFALLSLPVLAA